MTAAAVAGLSRIGPIRPRFRRRELGLLVVVALALIAGSVSLGATRDRRWPTAPSPWRRPIRSACSSTSSRSSRPISPRSSPAAGPTRCSCPAVGLLGGIGLLLMERLPQDLGGSAFGDALGLAGVQLVWLLIALTVITILAIVVRSDTWLRRYKYTWAAAGIGLLLLTFVFGEEVNGALLTLQIGPVSGQPTELLKVILVVFLAGYLSEIRPLLVEESTRLGPLRLPPLPYLLPMIVDVGDRLRDRRHPARPRRGPAVLRRVPRAGLRRDGARPSYVVLGLILLVRRRRSRPTSCSTTSAIRVDIWLDPFADPSGAGYQVVQALVRVRPRRDPRDRPRRRPADGRRPAADPGHPHRLPARGPRRGARA